MKILITGFEPFDKDTSNPSSQVLSLLPQKTGEIEIVTAVLPVVRRESSEMVFRLIEKEKPDAVISLGLAAGRKAVTIERTAVNVDDYRIKDNKGNQPHDEPVVNGGPDAYFSSLPIRKLEKAILEAGYQAAVSESAGTFVCNHVFYAVRHYCHTYHPEIRSGFIHLPCSEEMAESGCFSMPSEDMAEALKAAVKAMADKDA